MFFIDTSILVAAVLLLLGIVSSKFSARVGMPVLVMFLGLGMLAGSEGLGGIAFEDYSLSYAVGTLALALILFSGGLATPYRAVAATWRPAGLLATLGVLVTAMVTGLAASWILQLPLLQGLLLGGIVGSTDAAAVFSVLRSGGVHLRRELADTLEVESGSNDPMAIFLTVGLIEVITGRVTPGVGLIWLFLTQMVLGIGVGLIVGQLAVWSIQRINLGAAGLYPVLATAFGLLSFGLAADLGGSGFLSVYLTGMVIGNGRVVFHRGIELFHDAAAWFGQIILFIMLGMLTFPSRLVGVIGPGLAVAVVLILLARPLAVALCLWRSRFNYRELLFLSWVGLKGAVPITLAIFPLIALVKGADIIFNVVFFVVVVSVVLQGWSLPWVARWLGLESPPARRAPVTLEISSLQAVDGDIVDYYVEENTRVTGKRIRELAFPDEVVIALIVRNRQIMLPKGSTCVEAGDHVIVVLRPDVRPMVDRLFAKLDSEADRSPWPTALEFPLRGTIRVGELEQFYGIKLGGDAELTLEQWIRQAAKATSLYHGLVLVCDQVRLRVVELDEEGKIEFVGMSFLPATQTIAAPPTTIAPPASTQTEVDQASATTSPSTTSASPQSPPS